jgi:nucleoside-diphosphate-sugar epimerase
MRTLLTGATGFIGSRVAALLAASGHEVLRPARAGVDPLDLTDATAVDRYLDRHQPEALIHLAAVTGSGPAMRRESVHYFQANLDVSRALYERAHQFNRVVLAGSAGEYPAPRAPRTTGYLPSELWDGPPCAGGYGLARRSTAWAFEARVQGTLTVLVFPTVYGPGDGGRGPVDPEKVRAVPSFAARILSATDTVRHFGTGREQRDLLHVDDAVMSVRFALERTGGALRAHVTDGVPRQMSNIAQDLSALAGFRGQHQWADRPDAPSDRLWLAPSGLDTLGFTPKITWEHGAEQVIADVRRRGIA